MSALLEELLHRFCPRREVRVVYTNNSCTMSSVGPPDGRAGLATFRLHQMFRQAPAEVLEALVRLHFVPNHRPMRRRLTALVRRFIAQNASAINPEQRRARKRAPLVPRGVYVNLAGIFDEMNQRYFAGGVRAGITWSRAVNRRQMGSCHDGQGGGERVIIVNRLLDDPEVPQYYLNFLVVHEMLHCVYPRRTENGHTVRHSKEMRSFEKKLPFHRQAIAWEKQQVDRLYRRRKRGIMAQLFLPFVR